MVDEKMPADWAIERAWSAIAKYRDDAFQDVVSLATAKGNIVGYPGIRAFAEYIEQHEEAPVDPLLAAAREIVARHYRDGGFFGDAHAILCGDCDDDREVIFALTALRRGIEIAKSGGAA